MTHLFLTAVRRKESIAHIHDLLNASHNTLRASHPLKSAGDLPPTSMTWHYPLWRSTKLKKERQQTKQSKTVDSQVFDKGKENCKFFVVAVL